MKCPQRVIHRMVLAATGVCALAAPALAQDCPELLGQWPGDEVRLVTGAGAYAYAGNLTMFMVADVSDPAAPDLVGQLDLGGGMSDMTAANGHVFVAIGEMWVIDVSEPTSPQIVGTFDSYIANCVAVSGQYAYLGEGFGVHGLLIVDVSTPSAPEQVGSADFLGDAVASAVAVSGQYAFLTWMNPWGTPAAGLTIIDVSNPSAPLEVGSVVLPGESSDSVAVYGGYAYVGGGFLGVHVVDVTNPAAPVAVGVVAVPGYAGPVSISEGLLWVADYYGGVRVLDLKNPETPVEVGFYDPPEFVNDVHVAGGLAFAANLEAGLLVFEHCELPVFADGFESGNTSAWSATVP
jgi:hypothetical protein